MKWKKIKNNLLSAFSLNINRAAFFVALFFFSTIINANTLQQKNNRYLWVVRTALIAEKNIDEMIQFATLNRINNIIVQVRGRGDAYYNSKIVSKSNLIKNKEFDPLLYTLNSAKDKGIKVHVWLNTYLLWSSKKLPFQKDHILLTNPEWLDHNKFSLPNIASELKKVGSKNNSYEGLYLSPDHPSVNKHLLNVFKELLLNYEIDILTDKEESEKRQTEFKENTSKLVKALEIDTVMAQLLVSEGFNSIKAISGADINDFLKIDGFDEETAKELQDRAKEFLEEEEKEIANKVQELGIKEDLANHKGLSLGMLLTLGEKI